MRQGQQKRLRGRNNNNRKGPNPLSRSYESNGPDVKIRGTAAHIADKYVQLARDAQSSGDPVAAENYFQHAEHYYRILAAAQPPFQQHPGFVRADDERDEEMGEDEEGNANGGFAPQQSGEGQPMPVNAPQPQVGREDGNGNWEGRRERDPNYRNNNFNNRGPREDRGPRDDRRFRDDRRPPREARETDARENGGDVGLPAFITGGGVPPAVAEGGESDEAPARAPRTRRRRYERTDAEPAAEAPEAAPEVAPGE